MTTYRRYGIFVVPEGAFYRIGASWLGWDSVKGIPVEHPKVNGLARPVAEITSAPRNYGFHGTIKPPFRLAAGKTETALRTATAALCKRLAPVEIPAMTLRRLGGFAAIMPAEPSADLAHLAAEVVAELDAFRATPTETEIAKRRKARLSARQTALLAQWGYPYVMEEFRFHLTLTGGLGADAGGISDRLSTLFTPVMPTPFRIDSLCIVGEDAAGRFHVLNRNTLSG